MAIPHWLNEQDVVWRVEGRHEEGVYVTRAAKHVEENRFGARVVDVRATEVDIKMYEGGTWKVFTVARSMAPDVIANDAVVLVMDSGDSISNYVVGSVQPSRFASAGDAASSTGVGIVE